MTFVTTCPDLPSPLRENCLELPVTPSSGFQYVRATFPSFQVSAFCEEKRQQGFSPIQTVWMAWEWRRLAKTGLFPVHKREFLRAVQNRVQCLYALECPSALHDHVKGKRGLLESTLEDLDRLLGACLPEHFILTHLSWEEAERLLTFPKHATPAKLAVQSVEHQEHAWRMLETAARAAGIQEFTWICDEGSEPRMLCQRAAEITHANAVLQRTTGWEGPVLGLAGFIHFALGLEPSEGGGCINVNPFGGEGVTLYTSMACGWGIVMHEWMHGLDFCLGQGQHKRTRALLSSLQTAQTPYQPLLQETVRELTSIVLPEAVVEKILEHAKRNFLTLSQEGIPHTTAYLHTSGLSSGEILDLSYHAWKDLVHQHDPAAFRPSVGWRAFTAYYLQQGLRTPHTPLWRDVLDQMQHHAHAFSDPTNTWADAGYFHRPEEILALCFEYAAEEGLWKKQEEGGRLLFLPSQEESLKHRAIFQRFFQQILPWWEMRRATL